MKTYTNGQRKAMMYGGAAKRKPMMYGGIAKKKRKKAYAGGMMTASPTQQNTQRRRQQQTAMSAMSPMPMASGDTPFGKLSIKAGYDNNPEPTVADRIAGAKMKK
jgi:hypothetical protein|tara:strand:- start:67 stop:381 length:315 start_codon:yes stop_codon:yes gene_type:complete